MKKMYRNLMEQGFGISQIDEWDIHWFFDCMDIDPNQTEKKHGYIDDIVW
ncbi:hypothetical protein [Cytobacillus firmus]|nr:hypothetical protein [Cytobacillus firmus]MED1906770.1 hypothetical protein [Cytobacillus firmus]